MGFYLNKSYFIRCNIFCRFQVISSWLKKLMCRVTTNSGKLLILSVKALLIQFCASFLVIKTPVGKVGVLIVSHMNQLCVNLWSLWMTAGHIFTVLLEEETTGRTEAMSFEQIRT